MVDLDVGKFVRNGRETNLGTGEILKKPAAGGRQDYQVYFADKGVVRWVPKEDLLPAMSIAEMFIAGTFEERTRPFDVRALGSALRWANATTGELLVSKVEPLPHQILLTHRVVMSEPVRRLVADDVGLGKTIETGMILAALRTRGRAARVLIVVPAGLVAQWIEEMEEKFDIPLTVLVSESLPSSERQWDNIVYAIASMDLLKARMDTMRRSGYWDVVVIDEAHRLSKSRDYVAQRFRLAEELLSRSRCGAAILLTATPHQGNNEKFINLLRLVRADLLPNLIRLQSEPDLINQILVRNRKLDVTDAEGRFIFDPPPLVDTYRVIQSAASRQFHPAMEQYLRESFRHGGDEPSARGRAIGFVMTTYAKLACSSPLAIRSALERRIQRVHGRTYRVVSKQAEVDERFEGEWEEERSLSEGGSEAEFFEGEAGLLEELISMARECESSDAKLARLLEIVTGLLDRNPEERVLFFTEYRGTQRYLSDALRKAFPQADLVEINGGMSLQSKQQAVRAFNSTASFLVSTEAGGEGINLQERCHIVVNYDLPWNPMRLRQRTGRLYRYGQEKRVVVINLRGDGATDELILEHLETKIDQVVHDLADWEGGREENLRDDILGQTVAEVPIEALVMKVHQGKTVTHVKAEVDVHMERVRECALLQRELFGGVSAFRLADYEKVRCPFGPEDVERFLASAVRELKGVVRERDQMPGTLAITLPSRLTEGRTRVMRVYGAVTTRREIARRDRNVEQFLFGHAAFDAIVEEVTGGTFDGTLARRHVYHEGAGKEGRYFEFHFDVTWLAGAGGPGVDEFVGVLVSTSLEVVDERWARDVIWRESSQRQVSWEPGPEQRRAALERAQQFVDGRTVSLLEGRRPQPCVLKAAALLSVNG